MKFAAALGDNSYPIKIRLTVNVILKSVNPMLPSLCTIQKHLSFLVIYHCENCLFYGLTRKSTFFSVMSGQYWMDILVPVY